MVKFAEDPPEMVETLMVRTHRLLKESGKSVPDVYADMMNRGSDISFYWLRKFASGAVTNPSVNKVEELYRYLTGKSVFEE